MEPQKRVTYCIGHRAGKQGPPPSVENQVEIFATATNSSNQAHEGHHTDEYTHRGPNIAISKTIEYQHE